MGTTWRELPPKRNQKQRKNNPGLRRGDKPTRETTLNGE
jgi:hypothetical protein